MSLVFFDTNVLVYLISAQDPAKQEIAQRLYKRCSQNSGIVLSVQVLNEFFAVATRKFTVKLSVRAAAGIVRSFASNTVMPIDVDLTFAAIERAQRSELNFWDALIVESALQGNAEVLYTEDLNHGQIFDGLRIDNPFR